MPLVEAGFPPKDNLSSQDQLVAHGPTLPVDVSFHDGDGNVDPKQPSATQIPALIDTGASQSCIDNDLAEKLGLPVVDRKTISGISGHQEVNMYMAHISSPHLGSFEYGIFAGVALKSGGQSHEVLIGRTFLRNKIMIYDGVRGQVTVMV